MGHLWACPQSVLDILSGLVPNSLRANRPPAKAKSKSLTYIPPKSNSALCWLKQNLCELTRQRSSHDETSQLPSDLGGRSSWGPLLANKMDKWVNFTEELGQIVVSPEANKMAANLGSPQTSLNRVNIKPNKRTWMCLQIGNPQNGQFLFALSRSTKPKRSKILTLVTA